MPSRTPVPIRHRRQHERWLLELTDLPTATGHETWVVDWIERWVRRRPSLQLTRDNAGNVILERTRKTRADGRQRPVYLTAHLDHPAFVVRQSIAPDELALEFRGSVRPQFFEGARLEVIDRRHRVHPAAVTAYDTEATPFPVARARLTRRGVTIRPGDVARWALDDDRPLPRVSGRRLHARACDDLAGVAAALSALDLLARDPDSGHLRVLFTRAEEIGFIGAIACCKAGTLPSNSALICLETSRSFADSPIGDGPILRVGDRTGVFSAGLTNRIGVIAARHAELRPGFVWQRKLMTGGTCEATAFTSFGYDATCLCLPLGNYHNMLDVHGGGGSDAPAVLAPEIISLDDFHGLVELLVVATRELHGEAEPFRARMNDLFARHYGVLSR